VKSLTQENVSLKSEISRLTSSSEKLRLENAALMVLNLLGITVVTNLNGLSFSNRTVHHFDLR
jgi:hypothetical protein